MKNVNNLTTTNQGLYEALNNVEFRLFVANQVLVFVYGVLCIFWFVYVIVDIFTQLKNKRRLVDNLLYDSYSCYVNSLFVLNESLFRNYLFLIFLIFEIIVCLSNNSNWLMFLFVNPPNINISIGYNCTLESYSYIGSFYDYRVRSILITILCFLSTCSFSMIIWLFGASLLHLSIAARNELKVKTVLKFILFGVIYNFILVVFECIPYSSVFGVIVQGVKKLMPSLSFEIYCYHSIFTVLNI